MSIQRPYRGVTADVRRERRRAALLEAALELMGGDDADISVRGVCARAKLTQRYFYESFANLNELQLALLQQIADEIALEGAAALAEHSPTELHDACRTAFEGAYSVFETDPRKARAMLVVSSGTEGLTDARRRIVIAYADAMRTYLGKELGEAVDSPRGRIALLYAVGGALEVTDAALNGDLAVSSSELSDMVGALLASSVRQMTLDSD
ncbi:TetR/AcrR family transcriptional regulator [Nocardioides immobilis]|uniref:TetR/AcrR family transcriptional regulator n=1 Tax=Nocardioides immobilis TaxID=2049295 RepID=A0A417Y7K9_9ACTN|nr:TetR/AcrR family transcriptional regulator [Nocardioides immobilis]RHW28673.1 TetR/AcrR family transcriptional regulator [Nocardioides immobilis]